MGIYYTRNRSRSRLPEKVNNISRIVLARELTRSNHDDEVNTPPIVINEQDSTAHYLTLLWKPVRKKVVASFL